MYQDLMPKEFEERLNSDPKGELIDVRTEQEYLQERIPGATLLDISGPDFFEHIQQLPRDKRYYVYCRSGGRSAQAAFFMSQVGLTVYNLYGGILAWHGPKEVGSPPKVTTSRDH